MTTKVINLRGANGSGKSFIISSWMARQNAIPQPQQKNLFGGTTRVKVPEYYTLNDGGIVVGPYLTNCGGCDSLDSTNLVKNRILEAIGRKPKYVLFEGVIISTVFETWLQFSRQLKPPGMFWVYLDTPLEVCLRRIQERNRGKAIKEQLVRDKIKSIESTRRKAVDAGEQVVILHHETALEEFRELMKSF